VADQTEPTTEQTTEHARTTDPPVSDPAGWVW
jgi:hypothetical protein